MFRLTKVKVAGAIVAGAVALGAAGAYAANTVPGPLTKAGTVNGQTLWALPGNSTALQASFPSYGDCVSWYASHKGFVLGGAQTQTVKKNYHGKLMSNISTICTKTKDSTSADTETQDSSQTDSSGDTGSPPAWAHSGHGRP